MHSLRILSGLLIVMPLQREIISSGFMVVFLYINLKCGEEGQKKDNCLSFCAKEWFRVICQVGQCIGASLLVMGGEMVV